MKKSFSSDFSYAVEYWYFPYGMKKKTDSYSMFDIQADFHSAFSRLLYSCIPLIVKLGSQLIHRPMLADATHTHMTSNLQA